MQAKYPQLIIIGTAITLYHRPLKKQKIEITQATQTSPTIPTSQVPPLDYKQLMYHPRLQRITPLSPGSLTKTSVISYEADPDLTWTPIKGEIALNPNLNYLSIANRQETFIRISHEKISTIYAPNCINLRVLELNAPIEKLNVYECTNLLTINFSNPEKLKTIYVQADQKDLKRALSQQFRTVEIIDTEEDA